MKAQLSRLTTPIAWIGTILLLVPFALELPVATLDASWKYGLNEAIARQLTFGKDLIFGFGPLAPVYSRMYHPGTDALMLGFGMFIAVALAAGCTSLCRGNRTWLLLALPILLAQIYFFDAAFLTLPFVFLLIVTRWSSDETSYRFTALAELALIGTAVALLPLVKGSFTGPALACGGLAWILIARRSRLLAVVALLWSITALAIAWRIAGQPVGALPGFFLAQSEIVSGYGEAMSLKGPMLQVVIFVISAASIIKAFATEASVRFGKIAFAPILGLSVTLFVAMKAGFVRHDVHSLIASSSLLLAAYFVLLMFRSRQVVIGMLVSVLFWSYIGFRHFDINPVADITRLTTALRDSTNGLMIRISDKEELHRKLDESLAGIRSAQILPAFPGTADIYPTNALTIIANGQQWVPRPILQSYSAFTPELLELNRRHLGGATAADRIYFSVAPIDGHYPSTEDGASWIDLMSRYRVVSFLEPYAILEKRSTPVTVKTGGVLLESGDGKLGDLIAIPSKNSPIWASIDIGPSWIGIAYGTLFKLPPLRFTIQYEDGTSSRYRFIPGTARAGFLLAPTVQSADDFAALQRPEREEFFKGRKLVSLEVTTKLWIQRLLWKRRYGIRLSEVQLTSDENIPAAAGRP
jgi:hypothetical protein